MDHFRPENEAAVRLGETIEHLHRDIAAVEFWANVVAEFAKPVPEYDPGKASIWLPREQAVALWP